MQPSAVEETLFRGNARREEAREDRTQSAADAVHRDRAHRVVDSDDFVKEAGIDLSKEHLTIGTDTTLSSDNFDTTMMAFQQIHLQIIIFP